MALNAHSTANPKQKTVTTSTIGTPDAKAPTANNINKTNAPTVTMITNTLKNLISKQKATVIPANIINSSSIVNRRPSS